MLNQLTRAVSAAAILSCACSGTTASQSAEPSASTAATEKAASAQGTQAAPQSDAGSAAAPSSQPAPTTSQATPGAAQPGAAQPQASATAAVALATQADVKVGAAVIDQSGQPVGTVESVDAEGAVISTGTARAKVPFKGIGKTATGGLVTSVTKADLEKTAAEAKPPAQ